MKESLQEVIQEAADDYLEMAMDARPYIGLPQQFSIQRYIDKETGKTYWEAHFFQVKGTESEYTRFYKGYDATRIYIDFLSNSRIPYWIQSITTFWREEWTQEIRVASRISYGR
jgi:hypothetical protein